MRLTLFHFSRPYTYSPLSIQYAWRTKKHYYLIIDEAGIWFNRKSDDLCWVWPCRRTRNQNRPWFVSGLGAFESLREIDDFWREYHEASRFPSPRTRSEQGLPDWGEFPETTGDLTIQDMIDINNADIEPDERMGLLR